MRWKDAYQQMKATAEKGAAQCERWAAVAAELRGESERMRGDRDLMLKKFLRVTEENERLRLHHQEHHDSA